MMISFLKKNSNTLVRMNTFQMAMIVFAAAVLTATVKNWALNIGASVLAIGLYLYLLYNEVWEIGAKDAIKIERGHEKYNPLKGLLLSIGANLLNLFLAILVVVSKAILVFVNHAGFATFISSGVVPTAPTVLYNLYAIPKIIVHILQFMYAGIFPKILPDNPFVYLLALILPFLFCTLGYIAGTKNFTIFPQKKPQDK